MIYFICDRARNLVKIGYTRDRVSLEKRLKAFATGNAADLDLLHLQEGDRFSEARIHRNFANLRDRNEWFRNTGALRKYLDQQLKR